MAKTSDVIEAMWGWAWPAGFAPAAAEPEPLCDVLAWRDDPIATGGEPIGWDLCYRQQDGTWASATYGGERISPPARWWPLPPMPHSEPAAIQPGGDA